MTPLLVVPRTQLALPAHTPPPPPRAQECAAPFCARPAGHRHHAVARSQQRSILGIKDALDYLEIDGNLVCVVIDLCWRCHDKLESGPGGCKSRLRWTGDWAWYDRASFHNSNPDHAGIWWHDKENDEVWKLRGFCAGEYRLTSSH